MYVRRKDIEGPVLSNELNLSSQVVTPMISTCNSSSSVLYTGKAFPNPRSPIKFRMSFAYGIWHTCE